MYPALLLISAIVNDVFSNRCAMAEFASAVVGLAAAGASVSSSLYALIDTLRDAPNELLALSDEVTDFRAIMARLVEAVASGEFAVEDHEYTRNFEAARMKGERVVSEIDTLVTNVKSDGYERPRKHRNCKADYEHRRRQSVTSLG
jgi:hypothetical protein